MITTYARLDASLEKPQAGESGAGELAGILFEGLRARGFEATAPTHGQYAHFLHCKSGDYEYEIMVAFDFVDGKTWEISCPPRLGLLAKLFGKSERQELGALITAVHDILQSDSRVTSIKWNERYGDRSYDSPNPVVELT
jgi:hypothetical protein